jgi:hypothetical protein
VLHGPIVLAAKTQPFPNEQLNYLADDSRMGHIAQGQVCPLESAPMLVSDTKAFMDRFKPVPGKPLTFTAPGLVQGRNVGTVQFIPFFRLHDSRYVMYWPYSTPAALAGMQRRAARAEAERLALDALTLDQVAPGEQQPESDHGFKAEGGDAGINKGLHWRHATGWFSYDLKDRLGEARILRLSFSTLDAGRKFDILLNGQPLASVELDARAPQEIYTRDFPVPPELAAAAAARGGKVELKFVAHAGSVAGGLYGLRLLKALD